MIAIFIPQKNCNCGIFDFLSPRPLNSKKSINLPFFFPIVELQWSITFRFGQLVPLYLPSGLYSYSFIICSGLHVQTCQPLGIKNCILWSQKLYFPPPPKLYFIIKCIFWGEKKYFCARSAHHEREVLSAGVQGPKGPGSTRVLGALWCNLSLIFEHYSKTLTKFS